MSDWPYDDEDLLTPSEVAAVFRVDPKTVTRWARAGRIPPVGDRRSVVRTPGGHTRILAKTVRLIREGEIVLNWGDEPSDLPATPVTRS